MPAWRPETPTAAMCLSFTICGWWSDIAKKFESNTTASVEDMISIGTIGLIKAVNTFVPSKNIKLATYASRCIGNEILMYLRKSSNKRQESSIDEPLNTDCDGNELLLSDVLGTDGNQVGADLEQAAEKNMLLEAVGRLSAGIAQSVEQLIRNQQVACSSHVSSSIL